jgi:hypothetical protein
MKTKFSAICKNIIPDTGLLNAKCVPHPSPFPSPPNFSQPNLSKSTKHSLTLVWLHLVYSFPEKTSRDHAKTKWRKNVVVTQTYCIERTGVRGRALNQDRNCRAARQPSESVTYVSVCQYERCVSLVVLGRVLRGSVELPLGRALLPHAGQSPYPFVSGH